MSRRIEVPPLPAVVDGQVTHTRFAPLINTFTHRHLPWLVDVAALPDYPWPLSELARFRAQDHLDGGSSGGGIRGDLQRFLRQRGIVMEPTDRVVMLAYPYSLGHVFNPLTVFWCLDRQQQLRAAVLEVHNTYRQRHAYLLGPDLAELLRGDASLDKRFYVSPFNDTGGLYQVQLLLTPHQVRVRIRLERDGRPVLNAVAAGSPTPATPWTPLLLAVRHPFPTLRVSALIRAHGISLWLRGLTVHPRPRTAQEAVR